MLEAPGGAERAVLELPMLTELPIVNVPAHSNDSAYPSLGWQARAARIALVRIADSLTHVQVSKTRILSQNSNTTDAAIPTKTKDRQLHGRFNIEFCRCHVE